MQDASVYLIFGGDEYLVSAKAREIVTKLALPDLGAFGLETIDGRVDTADEAVRALGQCEEAIRTPGFFGRQKVVWLRDATILSDSQIADSERVKSRVDDLTEMIKSGLPGDIRLVISCPKVDKRQGFFKACASAGEVHEFALPDKPYLVEKQAMERLREMRSRAGLQMSQDVAGAFLGKVGADSRRMVSELEKLAVYMGDRRDVSMDDIEILAVSSREMAAWDLADAVGNRDLTRALNLLRELMFHGRKESPVGVLMGLESRLRELMFYREALDKRWFVPSEGYGGRPGDGEWRNVPSEVDAMLSEHFGADPRQAHPYRMRILAEQARRFTMAELKRNHRRILKACEGLMSSSIPSWMAIEVLLVRMIGPKRS